VTSKPNRIARDSGVKLRRDGACILDEWLWITRGCDGNAAASRRKV